MKKFKSLVDLFSDKSRWLKRQLSGTRTQVDIFCNFRASLPSEESTNCFCLIGAVFRLSSQVGALHPVANGRRRIVEDKIKMSYRHALNIAIRRRFPGRRYFTVEEFNDDFRTTFDDIVVVAEAAEKILAQSPEGKDILESLLATCDT